MDTVTLAAGPPDDLEIPVEAQGRSIFGANHVDGRGGWERLVAHELAHQWFGNSLTVRSWRHIWLNEGFACYAEWLWSEYSGGPSATRLAQQAWTMVSALPQDLVLADPGPALMFDDKVYRRGAVTLHALRTTMGDTEFVTMLRAWTARSRHLLTRAPEPLLRPSSKSEVIHPRAPETLASYS